jgi:hypothetical protein
VYNFDAIARSKEFKLWTVGIVVIGALTVAIGVRIIAATTGI